MNLDRLELEWLHKLVQDCQGGYRHDLKLWVVWESTREPGRIEMGPCRGASKAGGHVTENMYDCSPFPGAWTRIPESSILRVTHGDIVRNACRMGMPE